VSSAAPGVASNAFTVAVANGTNAGTFKVTVNDAAGNQQTADNIPDANPGQVIAAVNGLGLVTAAWSPATPAQAPRPNNAAAANLAGGTSGSSLTRGAD